MVISKFSAPGSIFLFGEHAVLHKFPAISYAINKRISVEIKTRNDNKFIINSLYGYYESDIVNPKFNFSYRFIISAFLLHSKSITFGINVNIESNIEPNIGLGSSGAITVAFISSLNKIISPKFSREVIFRDSFQAITNVQGKICSGTDIASSVFGGIIYYKNCDNVKIKKICNKNFIKKLVYIGYSKTTKEVIDKIKKTFCRNSYKYNSIINKIGICTENAYKCIINNKNDCLINSIIENQHLLEKLNLCDNNMKILINNLYTIKGVLAVKISGSGLGDCIYIYEDSNYIEYKSIENILYNNMKIIDIELDIRGIIDETT